MKLTAGQKWLRIIAWLRRNFPASSPVYVQSIPMKGMHGCTTSEAEYFQISIHRNQSIALRIETLIHEWAHVLSWFGAETHLDDHSAEWGLAYARIYRTFVEWNYGMELKQKGE